MSDISGAIGWPIRAAWLVLLIFLARRALMLWVPVPHLLATLALALAMAGALWLAGNAMTRKSGLRRPYDSRLRR